MKTSARLLALCLAVFVLAGCPAGGSASETEPFIDLDLSAMSGTVVYAQVYNLMYEYQSWLGKTIRIAGYYNYYDDQSHGVVYHACIVPDATACCAQGIEFVLAGEHAWPEEYPAIGTDIVVTGQLELYEDEGVPYLHLVNAEMVFEETPEVLN